LGWVKKLKAPDRLSGILANAQQVIATIECYASFAGFSFGYGESGHTVDNDLSGAEISDGDVDGIASIVGTGVTHASTSCPEAMKQARGAVIVGENFPAVGLRNSRATTNFSQPLNGSGTISG
jgi:hypothetical protein